MIKRTEKSHRNHQMPAQQEQWESRCRLKLKILQNVPEMQAKLEFLDNIAWVLIDGVQC